MTDPLVVVTDSDLPESCADLELLRAAGLHARRERCASGADVMAVARDADALIVQWAPIDADVLDALDRCRFISRLGIGYDMIDVEAATRRGIAVANTPDYCVEEVAAHTVALILAGARGLFALDRAVRDGRWSATADAPHAVRPSLATVAVVGFGRIGSLTARHCAALGFRVVVHDPHVPGDAIVAAGHTAVSLDHALNTADIITLHAPLTARTRHLIGGATLAQMRPGALLVNTCRGGLVDEAALAAALREEHLGGAALDVFHTEPLPADSPLRTAPNVVLTPHAAWYSRASLAELPLRAAQQVVDFLAGRPVPSIVNPEYRKEQA